MTPDTTRLDAAKARIAKARATLQHKADLGGNPCVPVPFSLPPNATEKQTVCFYEAYATYLEGLASCHGDQACCAGHESEYYAARERCEVVG